MMKTKIDDTVSAGLLSQWELYRHPIAIWEGDGEIVLDIEGARRLRKVLKKAIAKVEAEAWS